VWWASAAIVNINTYSGKPQATAGYKNGSHDQGENSSSHLAFSLHMMLRRAKIFAAIIVDI
jgi:hypothetical protein